MAIAHGNEQYTLGNLPVTGVGLSWDDAELDLALQTKVLDTVFDKAGTTSASNFLSSLSDTAFSSEAVSRILAPSQRPPENWRVGEAVAECYLVEHRQCDFPWPDGRDERKSGSNLPGADLVGFQSVADDFRFTFGEVKTSQEENYPPNLMFGRTGLQQQLEDLRDDLSIRDTLVKYLCHRVINSNWRHQFQLAFKRYSDNYSDVCLWGFLVRDVIPNQADLSNRLAKLGKSIPDKMEIHLIALYLPLGAIDTMGAKVVHLKAGGQS